MESLFVTDDAGGTKRVRLLGAAGASGRMGGDLDRRGLGVVVVGPHHVGKIVGQQSGQLA